jgi:hypothetical protein
MRVVRLAIAAALLGCSAAAPATTINIFVDPMTIDHYTKVIQTPGPDRAVMCMAPPAVADCREISFKRG